MSIEWTDAEREAVRRALDHHRHMRFGLPDALLAALAPHVEAMLDRARAEGAEKALREAAAAVRRNEKPCRVNRSCHEADAITLEMRADRIGGAS